MGDPEVDAENEILKTEQDRQVFFLMSFFDLPALFLQHRIYSDLMNPGWSRISW